MVSWFRICLCVTWRRKMDSCHFLSTTSIVFGGKSFPRLTIFKFVIVKSTGWNNSKFIISLSLFTNLKDLRDMLRNKPSRWLKRRLPTGWVSVVRSHIKSYNSSYDKSRSYLWRAVLWFCVCGQVTEIFQNGGVRSCIRRTFADNFPALRLEPQNCHKC